MGTTRSPGGETGERGATLSVGQRQRISIARAFHRDALIMILDELSSTPDAETERTVRASPHRDLRKGKTTLVVSHHPRSWPTRTGSSFWRR